MSNKLELILMLGILIAFNTLILLSFYYDGGLTPTFYFMSVAVAFITGSCVVVMTKIK